MSKLIPTSQQQDIIASAKAGKNITVKALAGSSKTTTCLMVAGVVHKHSLYVAYNKSIATEAATKFPAWVECRTMHSIAWQAIVKGTKFRGKLNGFLDRKDVAEVCDLGKVHPNSRASLVEEVISLVTSFCNSGNYSIDDFLDSNIYRVEPLGKGFTIKYWESMIDPNSKTKIHHDTYLKLYQLSRPKLDYQLLYLDESQDFNPAILAILLSEENSKSQKIFIGDPYQSIYGFREAINAFDYLPSDYTSHELTTSFRFTQEIADKALAVLRHGGYKGELTGAGNDSSGTKAYLARTNADLFAKAVELAEYGNKIYVVGGMKDLFSKLYSAMALRGGKLDKVYDKQIASFSDWDSFVEATKTQLDLAKIVTILKQTENGASSISLIKSAQVEKIADADVILSTAHKSKGLGFEEVTLVNGFIPTGKWWNEMDREEQREYLVSEQILNLIYISITRSEKVVNLPSDIKEWFGV